MQDNAFLKAAEDIYDVFKNKSGLDYLRHMMAHNDTYPFGKLMNMRVADAGDGFAVIEAEPGYQFYNPMMRIHGGWLATLVDASLGSAVITNLPAGSGAGTVQLNINYLKKVDVSTGLLTARAQLMHSGRTMLTAETKITGADGQLYVHGSGTFLIYPK